MWTVVCVLLLPRDRKTSLQIRTEIVFGSIFRPFHSSSSSYCLFIYLVYSVFFAFIFKRVEQTSLSSDNWGVTVENVDPLNICTYRWTKIVSNLVRQSDMRNGRWNMLAIVEKCYNARVQGLQRASVMLYIKYQNNSINSH